MLLVTTDINCEWIFIFSVSPPLMQKLKQHVKYDSFIISIVLFVCNGVFADRREEILGQSASQERQFSLLRVEKIVEFVELNFETGMS